MFKKTGKTTTLGVTTPPKNEDYQVKSKPKDNQEQKPQGQQQK